MEFGHVGLKFGRQKVQDKMGLAGSLDLFTLMVEYVAGSLLLSLVIWIVILLVTGIMGRLSMKSINVILLTFICVAGAGYVGSLATAPLLLFALWYMISGILNYINQIR